MDSFQSFWVLCYPRSTCDNLKNSEITKLQTVAFGELTDDLIEKRLNYRLNYGPLSTSVFGNSVDKFFLRGC